MELYRGGSLASKVPKEGPLPVPEWLRAFIQSASAIEAASQAGILHRDIKPDNILFDENGDVRVGDFGLAYAQSPPGQDGPATAPGTVIGTLPFMAPERARGERGDLPAENYSLGATFYFAATGRFLFDLDVKPENRIAWLRAHEMDDVKPIRAFRPDFPEALEEIVRLCLAKSPGARYQTPRALLRDLVRAEATIASAPTKRLPPPRPEETGTTPTRPAGVLTEQVQSVVAGAEVSIVSLQAAFQEKHGADCFASRG